ncbi:7722_t:CDS:2 [Funneliformis mosseae]|uniref:7722_t:CDS:1 n=1 Tax=Funneliformis mosseae TaxID=27381 RepID=A0A9N9B3Y8_FUNMO|nr:7722_t:CDS:2 [Funneliformis mosseae]
MSTKKRIILIAAQKREICETKEKEPNLSNVALAQNIILENQHGPKWPQLENALSLWIDNAFNTKQDIDGNILKTKADFFARRFSIEDFHQSEGWLTGFKKRQGLRQFQRQGEALSAPSAESIENDRIALQQFLKHYDLKDIWNGDETGLFWKMEPSKVLAHGPIFDDEELERLISLLPKGDLNAREYIHIEDKAAEGGLTDDKIIDAILNVDREEEHVMDEIEFVPILEKVSPVEAENAVDKIIRFYMSKRRNLGR